MAKTLFDTYCASCIRSKWEILRLKPTERCNIARLSLDTRCKNQECDHVICSECVHRAWNHYSWTWDEEYPGSYRNQEDDTLDMCLKFERKLLRCKTCTPIQPVFILTRSDSEGDSDITDDYSEL